MRKQWNFCHVLLLPCCRRKMSYYLIKNSHRFLATMKLFYCHTLIEFLSGTKNKKSHQLPLMSWRDEKRIFSVVFSLLKKEVDGEQSLTNFKLSLKSRFCILKLNSELEPLTTITEKWKKWGFLTQSRVNLCRKKITSRYSRSQVGAVSLFSLTHKLNFILWWAQSGCGEENVNDEERRLNQAIFSGQTRRQFFFVFFHVLFSSHCKEEKKVPKAIYHNKSESRGDFVFSQNSRRVKRKRQQNGS